jgi:hypothetical protein
MNKCRVIEPPRGRKEDIIRLQGRHAIAGGFLVESRLGTAVEAAHSSEGIFTSILLLFFFMWRSALLTRNFSGNALTLL